MIRYSLFDLSEVKVYSVKGEFVCRAKRVMPVHPLARVLGTPKDVTELQAEISRQRRLERQTVEGAKELAGIGKVAQLDWQKVIEAAPGIVEKLERAEVTLPALEEHIPEECIVSSVIPRLDPPIKSADGIKKAGELDRPIKSDDDNIRKSVDTTLGKVSDIPRLEPQTRPIFETPTERYEWHLQFGTWTDEDRAWCNWFMTTDDFKMLYTYFEKQQRAGSPGQAGE